MDILSVPERSQNVTGVQHLRRVPWNVPDCGGSSMMGKVECMPGVCICNPVRNYRLEYYFCVEVVKEKLHITERGDNKTKAWDKFSDALFLRYPFKQFKPVGGQSLLKTFDSIVHAMEPSFSNEKGFDAHQFDGDEKRQYMLFWWKTVQECQRKREEMELKSAEKDKKSDSSKVKFIDGIHHFFLYHYISFLYHICQ